MSRRYYVYILTNESRSTLYVGVTNNLTKRTEQHKSRDVESFTERYNVDRLVYYEEHADVHEAIKREKLLKRWHRGWKERLIAETNPSWKDLSVEPL